MRELVSSSSSPTAVLVAAGNAALRGWWEDVNESPAWQDGAFFSLTAAYALVSAVALVSPSPRLHGNATLIRSPSNPNAYFGSLLI